MYERILVGTDGSKTAAKAVDRAVELAQSTGARLTIMSAARPAQGQPIVDAEKARHGGAGIEIDTAVIDGDPVSALLDEAARGYDVLVVGNKGMTGAKRFLQLGSVPNKVSHHLPCTMLIVKTT